MEMVIKQSALLKYVGFLSSFRSSYEIYTLSDGIYQTNYLTFFLRTLLIER